MDELLEIVDVLADSGFEGIITWILRLIGLIALLVGLGLLFFTEMGLLLIPGVLIISGLILLIVPSILLALIEIAG